MCFAPQRRALFRHLNFQKWSDHGVFCTFWLQNVLRATMACTFSTSQLPKVVRSSSVLSILTWKCASRHNGVHFFMSHLASWLRTRRFSEPTFRPSGATNHWKNTVNRDFPIFSRIYLFFLLIFSLLTLLTSAFQLSILSEVSLLNFLRSCCGHNGVWTRIQRDMDITKMNKIPQNCSENWWCQIESVYQEASDSPRLNQERHGCDLRHTELSTASLGRRLSWMRHLSWLLLFRRRLCTCDLAAAEPLYTVTKSRACHAKQLRRPAARAYRESPSAAPATRDTREVKRPEALQRVAKCRACHSRQPRREASRGPTESHQVPCLPRKAAAASTGSKATRDYRESPGAAPATQSSRGVECPEDSHQMPRLSDGQADRETCWYRGM